VLYSAAARQYKTSHRRDTTYMTLVGALHCGDYLLLGAESGWTTETGVVLVGPKLSYRTNQPIIAWGFSGNEDLGIRFGQWLATAVLATDDWSQLRATIESEANTLNRDRRARLEEAGLRESRGDCFFNDFLTVIICGFCEGEGRILSIDPRSIVSVAPQIDNRALFIGETSHADVAYSALVRHPAWRPDPDWFNVLMDIAIGLGDKDNLRQPCRILKITPKGVEDISGPHFRGTFGSRNRIQ